MNTNLGNRIKNLRKERHLSQEYVVEQIGVSRQSVSKWESGISRPSTGNLICLAELFDVLWMRLRKKHQIIAAT